MNMLEPCRFCVELGGSNYFSVLKRHPFEFFPSKRNYIEFLRRIGAQFS